MRGEWMKGGWVGGGGGGGGGGWIVKHQAKICKCKLWHFFDGGRGGAEIFGKSAQI